MDMDLNINTMDEVRGEMCSAGARRAQWMPSHVDAHMARSEQRLANDITPPWKPQEQDDRRVRVHVQETYRRRSRAGCRA